MEKYHSLKILMAKLIKSIVIVLSLFKIVSISVYAQQIEFRHALNNTSSRDLIIDDLVCRGNENTDCSFITKKYFQQIGDTVDPNEIFDAKLRLGTLFQFKNIRILLEKSTQRNHVNVVFEVEESEHIQFGIGTNIRLLNRSYSGLSKIIHRNNTIGVDATVTDFNFLGSGQQLSLHLSTSKQKGTNDFGFFNVESDSDNTSLSLNYLNPHLYDSKRWYLSSNLQVANLYSDSSRTEVRPLSTTESGQYKSQVYNLSIGLGVRFGSNSYLELFGLQSNIDDESILTLTQSSQTPTPVKREEEQSYNEFVIGYGWDSRDDIVFPTQGSAFRIDYNLLEPRYGGLYRHINIYYANYHSISDNLVFSYDVANSFKDSTILDERTLKNTVAGFSLSKINAMDKKNGRYSGWKFFIKSSVYNTLNEPIVLGVSYTHQTDRFIASFSFVYDKKL